eukprot:4273551-Amphidinium_carterae.1
MPSGIRSATLLFQGLQNERCMQCMPRSPLCDSVLSDKKSLKLGAPQLVVRAHRFGVDTSTQQAR